MMSVESRFGVTYAPRMRPPFAKFGSWEGEDEREGEAEGKAKGEVKDRRDEGESGVLAVDL